MPKKTSLLLLVSFLLLCLFQDVFLLFRSLSFLPSTVVYAAGEEKEIKKKRKAKHEKENGKEKSEEAHSSDDKTSQETEMPKLDDKSFDKDLNNAGVIDAVLLLDASRSMQRTDPRRLRDQGAKLFLRFLGDGDRISVIQFDRDAKVVFPLTEVAPSVISQVQNSIESIPDEGNFTDLHAPVAMALDILLKDGRKDVQKCIVLLSDGKMDPSPIIGSREQLTNTLINKVLSEAKQKGVKVYTIALSNEADKKLLFDIAKASEGMNWFASDANSLHEKFSDLFLELKKPQVVAINGSVFEIDNSTSEVTFYVSRKEVDKTFSIVSPQEQEWNQINFPTGVKWFRGNLFDVITVSKPMPGRWLIKGLEDPEGFATLLSDLKLQAKWPETNLTVGNEVRFAARLTEGGKVLESPDLEGIVFYSYKIINSSNGMIFTQGGMSDDGKLGDETANDKIFSAYIKMDKAGQYKVLISATAPTFTRAQYVSFSVSEGLINIVHIPEDIFAHTPEKLQVVISQDAAECKEREIVLVAQEKRAKKPMEINLEELKLGDTLYDIPPEKLLKGEYELLARFSCRDTSGRNLEGHSQTIKYTSNYEESKEEQKKESEVEKTKTWSTEFVLRIASLIFSIVLAVGVISYGFIRSRKLDKGFAFEVKESSDIDNLKEKIRQLSIKSSSEKRTLLEEEKEMFLLIGEEETLEQEESEEQDSDKKEYSDGPVAIDDNKEQGKDGDAKNVEEEVAVDGAREDISQAREKSDSLSQKENLESTLSSQENKGELKEKA